jgi:hypothetical protein
MYSLDNIVYKNPHEFGIAGRNQARDAFCKRTDKFLWHERTQYPYSCFKAITEVIWFVQFNATKEQVEKHVAKYGGYFIEGFYNEDGKGFPAFKGEKHEENAINFLNSEDYKLLSEYGFEEYKD